jgi:hypothetical protein
VSISYIDVQVQTESGAQRQETGKPSSHGAKSGQSGAMQQIRDNMDSMGGFTDDRIRALFPG